MSSATALPAPLRERLRPVTGTQLPLPRAGKAFVLYVLRTAHRAADNPALEVALRCAAALDLPLWCVAVVEDSYPASMRAAHAITPARAPTDRLAAFRLEALRELQPRFAERGTVLLVHVERDGNRAAVTMSLAAKAALVICDEHFGIEPHASAAARISQTGAPLWLCDAACIVPSVMLTSATLVGGNAGFLRATAAARAARLRDDWMPPPAPPPPYAPPPREQWPPWATDLSAADAVDMLLAAPSRRDRSVGRVWHTHGGPRAALHRWQQYVASGGLKSYAAQRNNPLAPNNKGASRMSAYVNLGMIDPHRMARDAHAAGADKYLSEFAGFRESAHLWCLSFPGGYAHAHIAVPAWARGQLRNATTDTDAHVPSLADLEAGRSGDALWDDCQRSLVLSGELHNNVRMAWGKAVPKWHAAALRAAAAPLAQSAPSAAVRLQAALDLLIRLNDRYALDGGAPPSYGGLLWCLGWRDKPGEGGCPTERPTSVLAQRIKPGDLERRAVWRCGGHLAVSLASAAPPTAVTAAALSALPSPPSSAASSSSAPQLPPASSEEPSSGSVPDVPPVPTAAQATSSPSADGAPPSKRAKALAARPTAAGTLWHFINRESAAALPPRDNRPPRDA